MTTRWESQGGRTLNWSITSALRIERNLSTMIRPQALTADPSFDDYWEPSHNTIEIEGHERLYVPLYEMEDSDKEDWITACRHESCYWVAVASKADLSEQQWSSMNEIGSLIHTVEANTKRVVNCTASVATPRIRTRRSNRVSCTL